MKHEQESLSQARYIVARYIRAGLKGSELKRRVERHAAMLRGTEPEMAKALEEVSLREVRGFVERTLVERHGYEWVPSPRLLAAQHETQMVAAICRGEET